MYLTSLFHFARDHSTDCPKLLLFVEEAHTTMPKPSTMGPGDNESRGFVGKIAQLALQGGK
jgi:uncharacterized protein